MFRYEAQVRTAVLATALAALTACNQAPQGDAGDDAAFAATMDLTPAGGTATGQAAADTLEHQMMGGGGDAAFAADMNLVHDLVMNNQAITRTVVNLPNGIQTLTESSDPRIAGLISAHVASMERRLEQGEVFNLFSPTIPILFENYDRIHSEFEYTPNGAAVVQTSEDPAIVEALQAHAAEVTELVDDGMMAMMRGMMESGMPGQMPGQMREMMMGRTPGGGINPVPGSAP